MGLLVVQLEADPQDRVGRLVFPLPNVEQSLAEIAAEVQVHPHIERPGVLTLVIVETLA